MKRVQPSFNFHVYQETHVAAENDISSQSCHENKQFHWASFLSAWPKAFSMLCYRGAKWDAAAGGRPRRYFFIRTFSLFGGSVSATAAGPGSALTWLRESG